MSMATQVALSVLFLGCGLGLLAGAPPESQPAKEEWPKLLHVLPGWSGGLAFSPDGKTLAGGVWWGKAVPDLPDGGVILWDVATGKRASVLKGYRGVTALAFSPDGKLLAEGD